MRVVFLHIDSVRQVSVKIDVPDHLMRGAGLHRLRFPAELDVRGTIDPGTLLRVYGQAWLGGLQGDWLGWLQAEDATVAHDQPWPTHLVLPLSDEQLAVIEQRRAGGPVQFGVQITVEVLSDRVVNDSDVVRWPARSEQAVLYMHADHWLRVTTQAPQGMALAVVLPTAPNDEVGMHLRDAIKKINGGDYGGGVAEARKCFDIWREGGLRDESLKKIVETDRDSRTMHQRFSLLSHGLWAVSGPAPHGDKNARSMV